MLKYKNPRKNLFSLKIALEYPNVRVLSVSGKDNCSDYLSRLGYKKSTFFSKTLSPIKIDKKILATLPDSFSWQDIIKFYEEKPELVKFSEKKLTTSEMNHFYLDLDETSCSVNNLRQYENCKNYLDKH